MCSGAAASPTKKINFMFSKLYQENKKCKNFKPILLYCGQKKTKTDYAIHFNNEATLLAVQLLSQLSLQIKNKHKKLSSLGNFEYVLSKAVCAAFLAAQTFSFTTTVISCLRFSNSAEVFEFLNLE